MLDYHLHLWPHGEEPSGVSLERIAVYCERAASAGIVEVALTEHLSRFGQADRLLGGFWDDDEESPQHLRDAFAASWAAEGRIDMDRYVDVVLEAKAAGLPVVLGCEVDHYRGRMDAVGSLLAQYPFDVLLGAVHWLGAWGFDEDRPAFVQRWASVPAEAAWDAYCDAIEEIAASNACDVLAHPDYLKAFGPTPAVPAEFYDRIADVAASEGLAAEVNSSGWHEDANEPYPAPALLARFFDRDVPITTASDAHDVPDVAFRSADLRRMVDAAGYRELVAFRARRPRSVRLSPAPAAIR